jgi:hypothetical protein
MKKITYYIIGILVTFNVSAQELNGPTPWEVIGNPFSQPNVTMQIGKKVFEWYGSGDVNNDTKIDNLDLDAMNSGVQNDMADVDGDGTPSTQLDKNKLTEFLNGNIEYLPGHWNELQTSEERISWLEKMIAINDALAPGVGKEWICANYINQMTFDFFGISNFEEFLTFSSIEFSGEYLARYNIPMYYFSTTNTNGVPHATAGVLVGNNPLNFEDFYFIGYNNDDRVYPGNFNMDPNSLVRMGLRAYVEHPINGERSFQFVQNMINWSLNNGEATLESYFEIILVLENPNIIEVHVGGIPDTLQVILNGLPFNYNCSPENLFNLGYDAIPDTTKENTILPINLEYIDSDTIRFSERSYEFTRKFRAWIYSGGITKEDSVYQRIMVDNITSVKNERDIIPNGISQNYPNPFNSSTKIKYTITQISPVSIKIYDVLGKELETLINKEQNLGTYELQWNADNLPSGIYFYRIQTEFFTETKCMLLIK